MQFETVVVFLVLVTAVFTAKSGHRKYQDVDMTINTGPLIVGGEEAKPYEFPWIVSIQRSSHSCGGSIVNENYVITAGHCAQGPASTYFIVAGEHNLSLTEGYEQRVEVSRIIVHEGYDDYVLENDIALMQLKTPLVFNERVQPAPLPSSNFVAEGIMVVAGWGRLAYLGPLPDVLMKVDVPLISLEVCREVYPEEDDYPIFDHNICAGYLEGEKDSCNGDSGGPLHCKVTTNGTESLNVCGLVSWGGLGSGSCAYPNEPGVYTATASFDSWITQNINAK